MKVLPIRNKTFANFLSLLHQLQKLILGRIEGGGPIEPFISIYHRRFHFILTRIVPIAFFVAR